ncbi:oligosaccharide flippase family protein [Xinfangfangia sp. D13-10-4-6]|uniref:oligosaccharide flippase family protein n=1 Tax=Pseudogemmobacter hezensis TaxID=2737662 RepID=UPI0015581A71|nr:oligosaccharide flippase family protein [Pseudogemmobacter hezensis]NPD13879.1 oligosaccharide flippase family protein [Pseudogemmobacter hezensis]
MMGNAGRSGLFRRALGGGMFVAGSYIFAQFARLLSNLVLTRLLFPEAFGVMALVMVVLVGLQMFSDVGIGPAISRSPRGDDPDFLNTAWTLNVFRGLFLWVLTCLVAWPAAWFYQVPELALMLPVAGLTLLIGGFNPTRIDTANRHLLLVRVTLMDLMAQIFGIIVMVIYAWITGSVWALVVGAVAQILFKLILTSVFLPGPANRFRWERDSARELVHFGKWILASTAAGFLLTQGDKAVLGSWLTMADLGHYNIGYFLASFPVLLAGLVVTRIMIPIYRELVAHPDPAGAKKLRMLRDGLTMPMLIVMGGMALCGPLIAGLLYDARYADVGAIITAVAMAQMPMLIGLTYDQAALAAGDGKGFFRVQAMRALLQTLALICGAGLGGLGGALLAQGLALALTHPFLIALARRHQAWDPRHDLIAAILTIVMILAIVGTHHAALSALFG